MSAPASATTRCADHATRKLVSGSDRGALMCAVASAASTRPPFRLARVPTRRSARRWALSVAAPARNAISATQASSESVTAAPRGKASMPSSRLSSQPAPET